jgi:uncharacterized protein (DUF433 family)
MKKWIVADPNHLGGKPRIDGTRISIAFLLESLAACMTIPEIVRAYPTLTEEAVRGALEELARSKELTPS